MALERAGCSSRLSPSCPPHILPQALCLRRSVEELEKWLEPVELKLRVRVGGPEQPGLDELLGAQGELDRQAGPTQAFVRGRPLPGSRPGRAGPAAAPEVNPFLPCAPRLGSSGPSLPTVRGTEQASWCAGHSVALILTTRVPPALGPPSTAAGSRASGRPCRSAGQPWRPGASSCSSSGTPTRRWPGCRRSCP